MGLCASKDVEVSAPPNQSQIRRTTQTQGVRIDQNSRNPAKAQSARNGAGKTLGGNNGPTAETNALTPKEAAAKAAEDRLRKIEEESYKGKLSQKLYQDKKKSVNAHLREQSEQNREKAIPVVYD
ncbi:unnamed protein product [Kuraishia capsulata CBS 1993]|uniref:Uncharacterized protein n=1 Tax=Kuraishia capsulata CBS 1993 TaxID=1382522 RepID=W6MGC6_9ASCO|nr:uncharacterized protein KUCA_T00000493001 [Kuraishia capsulata CBS 1993]CDK24528.1 unnamed protein product [Kuraishia capsulata CBS 1993]